jgi:hypothetical protein
VSGVQGQTAPRLWVLQQPDSIVEYDVATFSPRRTLRIPRRVIEHPEHLTVNARGQIAFLPPVSGSGDPAMPVWVWDGRDAREWDAATGSVAATGTPDKRLLLDTRRQWFLSAGGDALFLFEQHVEKRLDDRSGVDRSVRSRARLLRTDLAGGIAETITTLSASGWCTCETGACSETCPAWSMWAPHGVVDTLFLVTRTTPGQLTSTYHETAVYRRTGSTWRVTTLPQPLEKPLDASPGGDLIVAAIPDSGCCGWNNESNDQTLLIRHGTSSVLYDEFGRYDNRNYDVSVYTARARLAPRGAMIAFTMASTVPPGDLRLSADGKDNPAELARLRKTITDLPAVEVLRLATPTRPILTLHRAVLVGWLDDGAIVVVQDGRLARYDVRSGRRTDTPIRVRTAADAFLR